MKTPEQNIARTLKGKKVLFLENDYALYERLRVFENILKRNNVSYTTLFDLENVVLDEIKEQILLHDAIVFETTWATNVSKDLREYVTNLKDKKIIINVYINEPKLHYRIKGIPHDIYIFTSADDEEDTWIATEFYKLTNKPYWEYKNKFNK